MAARAGASYQCRAGHRHSGCWISQHSSRSGALGRRRLPLNPALRAVQAVVAGQNPAFGSLVAVVAWAVVALVASMGAVGRRRQTSAKALLGSG